VTVPDPTALVVKNEILALPSPESVTATWIVPVFTKFKNLLVRIELLLAETLAVFPAALAVVLAVFA
jgi:hypothetical protein